MTTVISIAFHIYIFHSWLFTELLFQCVYQIVTLEQVAFWVWIALLLTLLCQPNVMLCLQEKYDEISDREKGPLKHADVAAMYSLKWLELKSTPKRVEISLNSAIL